MRSGAVIIFVTLAVAPVVAAENDIYHSLNHGGICGMLKDKELPGCDRFESLGSGRCNIIANFWCGWAGGLVHFPPVESPEDNVFIIYILPNPLWGQTWYVGVDLNSISLPDAPDLPLSIPIPVDAVCPTDKCDLSLFRPFEVGPPESELAVSVTIRDRTIHLVIG